MQFWNLSQIKVRWLHFLLVSITQDDHSITWSTICQSSGQKDPLCYSNEADKATPSIAIEHLCCSTSLSLFDWHLRKHKSIPLVDTKCVIPLLAPNDVWRQVNKSCDVNNNEKHSKVPFPETACPCFVRRIDRRRGRQPMHSQLLYLGYLKWSMLYL